MALGKKDAPAPPDFGSLADKQTAANRPDQTNPFGSTTWDPAHQSQTTAFSGALAPLAGSLQSQAGSAWAAPLDNGEKARQAATGSLYTQATSRLDPMWNQREQATNAGLANSGLDPTSEAGQKTLQNFNLGRNDAYSSAENNAVAGGASAAQQQQQLDLNSRNAPLSALSGLKGLLQQSGYGQAGDYVGAGQDQYGANMKQFDANGGPLGGWGQLLTTLMPLIKGQGMSAGGGAGGGAGVAAAGGGGPAGLAALGLM